MLRKDGRSPDELRPLTFTPDFVIYPEGSVLIAMGNTKVLCNVSIEIGVPKWKLISGVSGGWITGEYSLLPRSTHTRSSRETRGLSGRTQEIKRLIGRSLRSAFDLEILGEYTCIVDCDVIQADGGTRTAAISGGYLALRIALEKMIATGVLSPSVFLSPVAAISVGILNRQALLDLNYEEDSAAEVDLNLVMNAEGDFIEIQGTAEGDPFSRGLLNNLLDLGMKGICELLSKQAEAYKNI